MTNTTLVNKDNKIKQSYYHKQDLVEAKDYKNDKVLVDRETYTAYQMLKEHLEKNGIKIAISSAYRSEDYQQILYDEYTIIYGEDYAKKIVAPVGASEHHTGLALDLSIEVNGKYVYENEELLKKNDIFLKIHKYLKDYGFILRYPKGKEHITGYPYEPWHIRYVGEFVAKIIYDKKYTLEEYLNNYSGVLLINKQKGMTSYDVVNYVSRLFGIKRVGHTGTLDPLAEGVLLVAIGKATKVVELLTSTYKEYIATAKLGIKTNTLDVEGETIATKKIPKLDNLEAKIKSFKKTYIQEVPLYSAVKVSGKKLYEYARAGEKVTLPKKEVTIKEIELLDQTADTFTFKTTVSKGCYIRSLINDIGKSLHTYATMSELTRTKQGKVSIEDTVKLDDINYETLKVYDIDKVLDIPTKIVDEKIAKKISSGQKLPPIWDVPGKIIFKDKNNQILGIYEEKDNQYCVWKNFV